MAERNLDDWLREDKTLRRFIELNIDLFSNLARVGYGTIEHLNIKEGKLLWKRQEIRISGNE
jgi:hypothetical protein